jgi:hypothetical protein
VILQSAIRRLPQSPLGKRKHEAMLSSAPQSFGTITLGIGVRLTMVEQDQNELPPEFVPSDSDVICGWARQNYHHGK